MKASKEKRKGIPKKRGPSKDAQSAKEKDKGKDALGEKREEKDKGKDTLGEKCGEGAKAPERKSLYPVQELEALGIDSSESEELSPSEEEVSDEQAAFYEEERYHPDKWPLLQTRKQKKTGNRSRTASQPVASSRPIVPSAPLPYAEKHCSDSFLSKGDKRKLLQAFLVFEIAEGGCVHTPVEYAPIKELAESVNRYGVDANFTVMQLERLATMAMTPNDWQNTVKAALPSMGQYMEWKALWHDASQIQARTNANAEGNQREWTFELLTGQGQFVNDQTNYDWGAYGQISAAAIKAWKALSEKGEAREHLAKILQDPQEPFSDSVARMTETAGRIFGDPERVKPLIEQLVYESASPECKAVITPRRNKGLTDWIKVCRGIGGPLTNAGLAAAILQSQNHPTPDSRKVCYNCGKPGHLKRECRASTQKRTPGLCTKCRKGYHWVDECRSVRDIQGKLIQHDSLPVGRDEGIPKNRFQGPRSQGPKKYGTQISNRRTSLVTELQEAPQDWTSVPPPNSY
uniref:igE-binding protein-like n=1 Tax=Arvicanthis niloticus TaxID=61156 RepID=UPI00148626CF|nr:igE-binding protein-like [Arvicanthis niloticus]